MKPLRQTDITAAREIAPYWSKARYYVDLSAGHKFRLWSDRVRVKAQLNVRKVLEEGRL